MSTNLRIFVSSTCDDLFQERRDIAAAVLDLGHSAIVSELPKRIPVNPYFSCIENCLEAIRNHSDILVVIVSGNYGSTDGKGRSITLQEYLEARSLRIPVFTLVRQKIWDLLPLYKENPTGVFSPTVKDNRVFEFIGRIMQEDRGNWIFPFVDAAAIMETLGFQLSCLLRTELRPDIPLRTAPYYLYINNTTILLDEDGTCLRALEYRVRNDTTNPIERLYGGDTSDKDMSYQDMELQIVDANGSPLEYKAMLDTPGYRRWDVVLNEPLIPGETFNYSSSFLSCDNHQMQTWVQKDVESGFIKYIFPKALVKTPLLTAVRDSHGWRDSPPGVVIRDLGAT